MATENDIEDVWDDEEPENDIVESNDEPVVRLHFNADKGLNPIRIDKYLTNRLEGATRNKVQQALDEGFIIVNGQKVSANYKVKPLDDIIVYETRKAELNEVIAEELSLNIFYEDDDVMVINKAAGMVVHPGCGNYSGTLVNGLAWYLQQGHSKDEGNNPLARVGLAHRIDKDTSGLVVIAKTEQALSHLGAQFKKHTVHRRYIALAWGDFEEQEGTVHVNVGRNLRLRKIMDTFPEGDYGKDAITHYKVLEQFNYVSLLELRLETGRTHQIRIHMKSIGHPLFNDATYGGDYIAKGTVFTKYKQFVENCFKVLPRHALHAKELGFIHPRTEQWVQFNSELPDDMAQAIQKWRTYSGALAKRGDKI